MTNEDEEDKQEEESQPEPEDSIEPDAELDIEQIYAARFFPDVPF